MNRTGKTLARIGVLLQLGLLIGFGVTLVGMMAAFNEVVAGKPANPDALATKVSVSLLATAIGLIPALIGAVFILMALFASKYRAPSFYSNLWAVSVLWLLAFPAGTVFGILMMIYLSIHRREFIEGPSA